MKRKKFLCIGHKSKVTEELSVTNTLIYQNGPLQDDSYDCVILNEDLDQIPEIKKEFPTTPVVILTNAQNRSKVPKSLEHGIAGIIDEEDSRPAKDYLRKLLNPRDAEEEYVKILDKIERNRK